MAYTAWNPSDKDANITLSNSDLTATSIATAWKSARAIAGVSSGKVYFEFLYDNHVTNNMFGLGSLNVSLASHVGDHAEGYGYNATNGRMYNNGSYSVAGDSLVTDGDVIGVAVDFDAGKLWFAKNGVWQLLGDPANGLNEIFSSIPSGLYPMCSPYDNGTVTTLRSDPADMTYPAPDGFTAGWPPVYFEMSLVPTAQKIALSIPAQSSELTDFPVLVDLASDSGVSGFDCSDVFDKLGTNSKKIAVEVGDTGVQTQVEIENWDDGTLPGSVGTVAKTHDLGSSDDGNSDLTDYGTPADNGTYYTFDGLTNGLTRATDLGNSSDEVCLAKVRIHDKNKGIAQIIWKDGGQSNGVAVGIDASGNLGIFGRSSDTLTSITIPSTEYENDAWYDIYFTQTRVAILASDTSDIVADADGSCSPADGSGYESVGMCGYQSPITGTDASNIEFFDGDIDILEICAVSELVAPQGAVRAYSGNGTSSMISASSNWTDYPASYAFDGTADNSNLSRWLSEDGTIDQATGLPISPTHLQWDFTKDERISSIRFHYNAYNGAHNIIKRYNVLVSDTGAFLGEETNLGEYTTDNNAQGTWGQWNDIAVPGIARYLRIQILEAYINQAVDNVTAGEVEFETTNIPSAQLWVKVPTLSATESTVLNLYYDKTQPDNTVYIGDTGDSPAQAVWDSNFVAVYHMSQDPGAGGACILDSTSNANHGTPNGTMLTEDLVGGLYGKAIEFDGANDYISSTSPVPIGGSTVEILFNKVVLEATSGILSSGDAPTDTTPLCLLQDDNGTLRSYAQTNTYVDVGSFNIDEWHSAASARDASELETYYYDGSSVGTVQRGVEGSGGSLYIGSGYNGYSQVIVSEVRVSDIKRSADWLLATNLSNTDSLITFSLASGGGSLLAFIEMSYGDLIAANMAATDMPYAILFSRLTLVEMPYSIKLAMALAMYYGDAPVLTRILNQHYGDAPALMKAMHMRYGDLLMLQKSVEMPFHILKPLQAIMEARYGINGEALQAIMEQSYNISEYNLLCKKLDMPYLLQSDAMVQPVSSSLTIAGNPVKFSHLTIEANRDDYFITGEAHLADLAEYRQVVDRDEVVAVCNETTYNFIVESKKRTRPGSVQARYIVNFVSPAKKLAVPWSRPLLQEFEPDLAENIINALCADLGPVEYLTEPFPVLADTLYANDEDERTVIRKLTQSVGARMQSNPDGSIRIMSDYPVPVSQWDTVEPDYYMTDERNFVSQDETPVKNSGENKYLVGNQLASNERTWTEQNQISDSLVEVLGFQVPWGCQNISGLTHSGGDWVHTPEYMGVVEEIYPPLTEDAEQVEFVAGFANASRSIYGSLEVEWLREQLGTISYAEDGKLEAELKTGSTDGYSLAAIRYLTRYHLWRVRDDVAEDVQYILWVEE